jgi:type IV pilus assembly protein PilY1
VGDTTNPNGLATPAVVDINGDNIADVIYAGDLLGNLWKFDINDIDKDNWDVAYKPSGINTPLFTATDGATPANPQPITSRPEVGRGPFGTNTTVYFGTGQFLGIPDLADTSEQTFYGILDAGVAITNGRGSLLEQTVIFQDRETFTNADTGDTFDFDIRVVSDNDIAESNTGWFMDLPDSGERVVSTPLLVGNRLIYVTIVPDNDACAGGGYSWLMEVDARNGGELSAPPFDLNNDGVFNLADMVDIDGDGTPDHAPGGMKPSDSGFVPTPVRLVEPEGDKEHKYMPSTSGSIEHVVENPGGGSTGRQSWRQVR